jgi:squalene cyclase
MWLGDWFSKSPIDAAAGCSVELESSAESSSKAGVKRWKNFSKFFLKSPSRRAAEAI